MKVTPVNSPHAIQQPQSQGQSSADARERAIAKLVGTQPPAVQEQNQVQPEEIPALTPQVPKLQNTTSVEPAAVEASEAPVKTPQQNTTQTTPPDAQLQALVRREKALRIQAQKQQDSFKAKEAELQALQAKLDARAKELEQGYIPRSKIKEDPLTVLSEAEVTYDDIVQRQLEAQNVNPQVKAALTKLAEQNERLQAKIEELTKGQESTHQEAHQAAIRALTKDASTLVAKDEAGQYEFIKHNGKAAIEQVVKLIETEFNETGEQLDVEEALRLVEAEYEERFNRLTNLKKVQSKLKAPTEQRTEAEQTPAANPQQTPQMKTLTNSVGSTRQLTPRERAIAVMEGTLKRK